MKHPLFRHKLLASIIFLIIVVSCNSEKAEKSIVGLQCETMENPNNIDMANPRLSWRMVAYNDTTNGLYQSAYEILVASSLENLHANNGDLWHTGKTQSAQQNQVVYAGKPLAPFQTCYWKVRFWDQNNVVSPWSNVAYWKMAVLNSTYWQKAQWIQMAGDTRQTPLTKRQRNRQRQGIDTVQSYPAPLFRTNFSIDKKIKSAFLYAAGLGYSEYYLNGKKIGNRVLDPGQTTYDKEVLYTSDDVTGLITKGTNTLGAWLGNGFYGQNMAFHNGLRYGKPLLKAILRIEYTNGSVEEIISNESWKCHTGPIVFDNVYAGETYDARLELTGWSRNNFNDTQWKNATIAPPPGGKMVSQKIPPIRVIKSLKPKNIVQNNDTTWTIDFGQNISGWAKISLSESEGKKITLNYAEALYLGSNKINSSSLGGFATGFGQEDIYICKGTGTETWEPRFTYHGFQYLEITGLSEAPTRQTIEAVLVHTDVKESGDFICSDTLLNQIYETSKWTLVDNLHSIPEDCPHREKCGWLGDAHIVAEFSIFNYNMNRFHAKYMRDIVSTFGKETRIRVPASEFDRSKQYPLDRIPTMVSPGKRTSGLATLDWGAALVFIPWYNYLYYADEQMFLDYYPDMKVFMKHMEAYKNSEGLIENGLGDWCPPLWDPRDNPSAMECHPYVSSNAFYYDLLNIMAFMSNKFGDTAYAQVLKKQAIKTKQNFNQQYLTPIADSLLWYGSQTATLMALQYNLVPKNSYPKVLKGLQYNIEIENNTHHTTGIFGHRPYYTILAENNMDNLAYGVLANPTFPSLAYILSCGITTWPERVMPWDSVEWNRSMNHPMQGGFAAFFHESILGIQPLKEYPGFKQFVLKPHFTHQLKWAKGSYISPYGKIVSNWKKNQNTFDWLIEIPPGTEAEVYFPTNKTDGINCNNSTFLNISKKQFKILNTGFVKVTLPNGKYSFTVATN